MSLNNAGNSFTGNGGGLTGLNASQLTTGTVTDGRLSANVALLNRSLQSFTGTNSFLGNVGIGTTLTTAELQIYAGGGHGGGGITLVHRLPGNGLAQAGSLRIEG